MCGIAGYKINKNIDESVLKNMVGALYHRGPDTGGFYVSGPYRAGMRRLKINDLTTGDQPLFNSDKSVVLLYNGEIYNSPELRRMLEKKGYRFRTRADGEVICHLYDEVGENLFEELDGMFAAALWIEKEKKLILARDIPGEKPLYYSVLDKTSIVFASEIKSIVLFPGVDLGLNIQGLWDMPTFTWVPEPETIYKNIKTLPKSHILIADENGIKVRRYENKFNKGDISREDTDVVNETQKVVSEAVRSRLLSDVPVGSFLSGGLDSSIIATLAAKHLPNLNTFTIGFEDVHDPYHGRSDESVYAASYAKVLGTKHHTIKVTDGDFKNDLIKFCSSADQPFAVPSAIGIMKIAKAARDAGIKVLLSGDCADECFGGYSWYPYLNGAGKALKDENKGIITFNNFGMGLEERLEILRGYSPQKRAWAWHYYGSEAEKTGLYNRELFGRVESSIRFFEQFKAGNTWAPEDFIKQDREFYLLNEMLQKVDRMTMSYSVEGRVPFAAPAVLSHAEKIKYNQMVRGPVLKWVLREAFRGIIPKEIYNRPKHGFNVPIDHWLKNGWADLLKETFSPSSNIMKAGIAAKRGFNKAYAMAHDKVRVNGPTLFSFIVLNIWMGSNRWKL